MKRARKKSGKISLFSGFGSKKVTSKLPEQEEEIRTYSAEDLFREDAKKEPAEEPAMQDFSEAAEMPEESTNNPEEITATKVPEEGGEKEPSEPENAKKEGRGKQFFEQKQLEKRNKRKKKLAILAISVATLLVAFVVVMGLGGFFSSNPEELTGEETITEEQIVPVDKATGKINILILGVDKEGLRTDTMIVASYDLDNDKVNLLSIPRDTRMYIGSRYQKINAAHAITQSGKIKGPQGSIEAVTRLTAMPINYYVEFSFDAFRNTIDALDGVDFDVPRNMNYDDPYQDLHIHLKKGMQHLDGDKAEQLVRFRRYPEGDIARVQVQQDFLKAVAEQKLNASIIGKLPDLYEVLKKDIKTNFTLRDVTKYAMNLTDLKAENIQMYQLPGDYSGSEYEASYWLVNLDETRTLIQDVFGYDASKATNHKPGTYSEPARATKKPSEKATKKPVEDEDEDESKTSKPTKKPSEDEGEETKKPSKTSEATKKPKETDAVKTGRPTAAPTEEPEDEATKKPSKTTEATKKPTAEPTEKVTEKPTAKPTEKATEKPTERTRPTAKPTEAPSEEE
ncbi:MAG: hypothetical protein E7397_04190 [Ruminococcaceae bacterium]|nr:hypothetical protein [Oscillospiraceae bacterium]